MKNEKVLLLAATLLVSGLVAGPGGAQKVFGVAVLTNGVATNLSARLACERRGTNSGLASLERAAGLTNATRLWLSSNRTTNELGTANGTNSHLIAALPAVSGGVSLTNTNSLALGSVLGTNDTFRAREVFGLGTNDALAGGLHTNAMTVYSRNSAVAPLGFPTSPTNTLGQL